MRLERSQVRYGNTRLEYGIRRSTRRATVAITVSPPGEILLTAPKGTSKARLDRVVHAKARWIVSRLRMVKPSQPEPSPREFVSGETFLYLGRQYRLKVVASVDAFVKLSRGFLVVGTTRRGRAAREEARDSLIVWYRDHAAARIADAVAKFLHKVEVPEPRVLVRDQERRWGSCSKSGVLRFNWRIAQAPIRLLEYVVAHELVHLLHDDHSKAFWKKLGEVLPDYERRRDNLRTLGSTLEW